MADFVVSDESDAEPSRAKKRKRPAKPPTSRKRSNVSPPAKEDDEVQIDPDDDDLMGDVPESTSTAVQWSYDPDSTDKHPVTKPADKAPRDPNAKRSEEHTSELQSQD